MRIHRLEIQAFGPFADRQVIDFDELGAHGLFLLNGPTGAGKTSVLDAICYALYGGVPGARQSARRLRSDHAAPDTAPEVLCDFSSGDRRFEVVRSPAWERPAKRGTGTVTEQAHTTLREYVDGGWVQKSARNDEAGAEILALMGMDKEQFTRVVMLPQGDFAAFLRADAATRADLLQKLFGTSRFEDIEKQLKEDLSGAATRLQEARGESEHILRRARDEMVRWEATEATEAADDSDATEAAEDSGATGPAGTASTPDGGGIPEPDAAALAAFSRSLSERSEAANRELDELTAALRGAEAVQLDLEQRRARGVALAQLEHDEQAHARRLAEVAPLRSALAAHLRAEALAGYLRAVDTAAARLESREIAAAAARTELAAHPQVGGYPILSAGQVENPEPDGPAAAPGAAEEEPADLRLQEADSLLTTELGAAEAALAEEQRISGLEQELAERTGTAARHRAAAGETAAETARTRAAAAELTRELEELREAAGRLPQAEQELTRATALCAVIRRFAAAGEAAADTEKTAQDLRGSYQDRRQDWQELQARRLNQAAAELARSLADGCACPVCGSEEHPAPAVLPAGETAVTKADEEAARLLTEAAEGEFEAARARADEATTLLAELRVQGGDGDSRAADAAADAARAALEDAETAERNLDAALRRSTELAARLEELAGQESQALLGEAQAEEQCGALRRRITELAGQVEAARGGFSTLAERVESLRGLRAAVLAVRSAGADRRTASGHLAEARTELTAALAGSEFDGAEAVREALLDDPAAAVHRRTVADYEQDGQRLALRRESEDAAAAMDPNGEPLPVPEEDELLWAAETATGIRGRLTDCSVRRGLLAASAAAMETYRADLAAAAALTAPLEERFALLKSVTETTRGGGENGYKMTLSTYVLAARLEQVAAAATERLSAMTGGRYALVHSDSKAGNRKAGLGLHVTDAWTGQHRDTSTLSGGESFMASLALALGLADVVQQEAGGVSIETLFVDEGFGSLDETSLEQVMDALEGLRDGGRVVGLVSHVAEMKQRIGAQLQITKGRNGSSVRFSAGQPAGV